MSINTVTSKKAELGSIQYRRKIAFTVLAALLVGVHFVFLMSYFESAISTPDAHSYFVQAKLLAKEGKTYVEPESVLQYLGPHWRQTRENHYFCTHAPGLAVIMAPVYKILGPKATLWVNPLMASLSLLGLFLLCRLWIGEGWGLLAAALMAANPFANEHALFGDSHAATCFLLVWGLFFVAKWVKRRSPWWAFSAGLFLGMVPTIRYPEVLYLPAITIFVFLYFQNDNRFWRSLMAGVIGVVIPIGALCVRNQLTYGAFWRTGYFMAGEQMSLFGWEYFIRYSIRYIQKLMSEGCSLVFGLGVTGIAILCARRNTWKQGMLFALLVVPITLVYMSFFWGPDPQSMRYFLPTFYIYTIAGVWLLCLLAIYYYPSALAGSIVLLVITVWWGLPQSMRSMEHLKRWNAVLAKVTDTLEKHVEPGSILIANEGINQHLDFIGYWRLIDSSILRFPRPEPPRVFAANRNILIVPREAPRNVEGRLKYGNLVGKGFFNTFSDDVWRWAGKSRKVYFVAKEEEINGYKRQLSEYDKLVTIDKIELPAGFGPPMGPIGEFMVPQGPMRGPMPPPPGPQGPNRIFDLVLDGKPLFLMEWIRQSP